MRSAVTVSLVEAARGGPFVFWDGLDDACQRAANLGFDAVELFAPGPEAVDPKELRRLLSRHGLALAAVGTGAGKLAHGLSLTDPSDRVRAEARRYIAGMIDFGAAFGTPAIIGSMQGRSGDGVDHRQAITWLAQNLDELGRHAADRGTVLLYEPLNRYETNLVNTIDAGLDLLRSLSTDGVRLLADLFHMNIEEADPPAALRSGAAAIGHVHFVDSNRRPAGAGHTHFPSIAAALRRIGYDGYLSAEALPHPTPQQAARQTIEAFRRYFA